MATYTEDMQRRKKERISCERRVKICFIRFTGQQSPIVWLKRNQMEANRGMQIFDPVCGMRSRRLNHKY